VNLLRTLSVSPLCFVSFNKNKEQWMESGKAFHILFFPSSFFSESFSSQVGRAECPIRHSASQKTELELELGISFGEPSQAQILILVTNLSRARPYVHSPRAELEQPLLARVQLVYMPI
jgi:hypothetical protein